MLPALSHHFHLTWDDIADMPFGELDAYLRALRTLQTER